MTEPLRSATKTVNRICPVEEHGICMCGTEQLLAYVAHAKASVILQHGL